MAPPVWEETGTRLRVTISTERVGEAVADWIDRAIVDMLDARAGLGTSDIAPAMGRSTRSVRTRLARLVERGLAVEICTGPTDPKR
ncbi:MAG: winged helix-turn-helix domain-containing protein [Rhodospirillaceae bacterium]|nr:winged helix-turn-helix domain-containing protein [Rhodospirillaceae bacterium]